APRDRCPRRVRRAPPGHGPEGWNPCSSVWLSCAPVCPPPWPEPTVPAPGGRRRRGTGAGPPSGGPRPVRRGDHPVVRWRCPGRGPRAPPPSVRRAGPAQGLEGASVGDRQIHPVAARRELLRLLEHALGDLLGGRTVGPRVPEPLGDAVADLHRAELRPA